MARRLNRDFVAVRVFARYVNILPRTFPGRDVRNRSQNRALTNFKRFSYTTQIRSTLA